MQRIPRLAPMALAFALLALSACTDTTAPPPLTVADLEHSTRLIAPDEPPDPDAPYPYTEPAGPPPGAYPVDFTPHEAQANSIRNAYGSDTLTSTYSWSDCIAYTYYGAKVNYNCPAGPCYQQWYNMRSAGWDFTGKINAFLTGALMLRNRWGLFATTLPAGTIITGNYLTLDLRQKQFLQCIHERDNWVFYNNDAPNTWIVPGMPK